jgi:hypothetical protein
MAARFSLAIDHGLLTCFVASMRHDVPSLRLKVELWRLTDFRIQNVGGVLIQTARRRVLPGLE